MHRVGGHSYRSGLPLGAPVSPELPDRWPLGTWGTPVAKAGYGGAPVGELPSDDWSDGSFPTLIKGPISSKEL